jgi:hypothetical protein
MNPFSNAELHILKDIAIEGEVLSALEEMEDAVGWVVLAYCRQLGMVQVKGLFDQPAAAMEYAAAADRFHNDTCGNAPTWASMVYPLLPP